jgi:hypothetical protein
MKAYRSSNGIVPAILTPALDEGKCHLHAPNVLLPGEETSVPIIFNILYINFKVWKKVSNTKICSILVWKAKNCH